MSTADASEAARAAARARWSPSPVVARSARVVLERADELDDPTRDAIVARLTEEARND
jgi:hypothetical protein